MPPTTPTPPTNPALVAPPPVAPAPAPVHVHTSAPLLFFTGLLALIVIGGGAYYLLASHAPASETAVSAATSTQATTTNTFIDTEYGFSFHYPLGWSVGPLKLTGSDFSDATVASSFAVENDLTGDSYVGYQVNVLHFSSSSPKLPASVCDATYSFDTTTNTWMQAVSNCDGATNVPKPYDLSQSSTASGLPIFAVQAGLGSVSYVIPLTTDFKTALEISSLTDARNPAAAYAFMSSFATAPIDPHPSATFDSASLIATTTSVHGNEPIISGTMSGYDQATLYIAGFTAGDASYSSTEYQPVGHEVPDSSGRWSDELPGSNIDWAVGSYPVQLRDSTGTKVLASSILKIILSQ